MDIQNCAAIVTGGASGLGEATARKLAKLGAKVALFDRQPERGEKVASEIGGVFCECDVANEASVDAALDKAAAAHGNARIIVNCAGIVAGEKTVSKKKDTGAIAPHGFEAFSKVISVNLIGSFHVSAKAAARLVTEQPLTKDGTRGVIIMTSSVAAEDGQIGQAAYAASKGGIKSLALPMARDLARDGIRVAAILPGLFHTPMFDSFTQDVRDALGAQVPFPPRLGNPEEYASLVQHICENEMLNGVTIRLDGAIRMQPR